MSPERPSSSLRVTRSMALPRSTSLTILSKMRRCASRKKSAESMTSAARLKASLCRRIAPRTERSASRLCGSVRSATPSGMSGAQSARLLQVLGVPSVHIGARDKARCATACTVSTSCTLCTLGTPKLLLWRAFGDDLHRYRHRHFAVQLHGDFHIANRLDRLRELQLALVDVEALGVQRFDDVSRGHRTVERI